MCSTSGYEEETVIYFCLFQRVRVLIGCGLWHARNTETQLFEPSIAISGPALRSRFGPALGPLEVHSVFFWVLVCCIVQASFCSLSEFLRLELFRKAV